MTPQGRGALLQEKAQGAAAVHTAVGNKARGQVGPGRNGQLLFARKRLKLGERLVIECWQIRWRFSSRGR